MPVIYEKELKENYFPPVEYTIKPFHMLLTCTLNNFIYFPKLGGILFVKVVIL